jgi:hypothetical protein
MEQLAAGERTRMPVPFVDGRAVRVTAQLHPAYAEALSRAGRAAERSLDELVPVIYELIEATRLSLSATDHRELERAAPRALDAHDTACESVVWWTRIVAGSD